MTTRKPKRKRNRLSRHDPPAVAMDKLFGHRDALARWRYTRQGRIL